MNICIVTTDELFPVITGSPYVIVNKARTLSSMGHTVYVALDSHEKYLVFEDGAHRYEFYPRRLRFLPRTNDRIARWWVERKGMPDQEMYQFIPRYRLDMFIKLLYLSYVKRIEHIHVEKPFGARACWLAKVLLGIPVTIHEHNAEYQRLADTCTLSKAVFEYIKSVEVKACRFADTVFALSGVDKKKLIRIDIPEHKIEVVPMAIDLDRYIDVCGDAVRRRHGLDGPVMIYHGALYYKPNGDAARIIVEKILPALRARGRKFKALVIGAGPPKRNIPENVVYTGAVEDLPSYIAAGDIAVMPIKAGGGIRIKALEYFASKKPVVSTSMGVEGIPISDGEEFILAETVDEFVEKIIRLVDSAEMRKEIADRAFELVRKYAWKEIASQYLTVFEKLKRKGKQ